MHPTPSRSLGLQGATNFRDLGGYLGAEGRPLRWRKLFRADHLAQLTTDDSAELARLGLARVVDFRGEAERLDAPYVLRGAVQHHVPIEPTVNRKAEDIRRSGGALDAKLAAQLMHETYDDFVAHNTSQFGRLFAILLESDAPLVFHCTAGKDRTGLAAALVLLALGVDRASVIQDYLLTNDVFQAPAWAQTRFDPQVRRVLWGVQAAFLHTAFDAIQLRGGLDHYLTHALHVGPAERRRLAELYLAS